VARSGNGKRDMVGENRRSLIIRLLALGAATPAITACAAQSGGVTAPAALRTPWSHVGQRAAAISKKFFDHYRADAAIKSRFAGLVSDLVTRIDRREGDVLSSLGDFIVASAGAGSMPDAGAGSMPGPDEEWGSPPPGWPPGVPWPPWGPIAMRDAVVLPAMARVLQSQQLSGGA
jgi:hypothetical protein